MLRLNHNHLFYFSQVVREGGVARAARKLRVSHPTVSAQVKALERALGERLLARRGRRVVPTEMGAIVQRYADEIFALSGELLDTVRGRPTGRPARLVVGVADALHKTVGQRVLEPVLSGPGRVHLVVREDRPERLFAELARHALDLVLSDQPVAASSGVRAYNHLLGESGVTLFAPRKLAARLRRGFPSSLDGAPFVLPAENSTLRRDLEAWFERHGVRPDVRAEVEDSALLKVFAARGLGAFAGPTVLEAEIRRRHGVASVGRLEGLVERYYAVSVERRLAHPAVVALCTAARRELFA